MCLLENVHSPAALRRLTLDELDELAGELREFLLSSVCRTGGHLGSNLGVVELTLALHRVFDSPTVPIVFDTGHQAYVHKILTGRRDGFGRLRTAGGLSGYPNRGESRHDLVENSHASTALSYADGLSKAFAIDGRADGTVVAVVGDGAMTGGLAWEALNNLGSSGRHVVVVLNDNGCSYSPTVGGLARHLRRLHPSEGYAEVQRLLGGDAPADASAPTQRRASANFFEHLGLTYLGPVDGHDIAATESALQQAAATEGPVVVHVRTVKGHGYAPAELDEADHLHAVGIVDRVTGRPPRAPASTWTDAFADSLAELGGSRPDLVAVSAAMLGPTGLQRFAERFPQRCFDVGIAEQHALTSAAGMAMGGKHPVVALYATFANRAFDQTLLDVGLHGLPVTLVLDRAGVTGPDGASHHGMWDLAMLGIVPGMRIAAPRDAASLTEELAEAVDAPGPTTLRFPKAELGVAVPAVRRTGDVDVLRDVPRPDVLVVAVGVMAAPALEAAERLAADGIDCTVVDPRWVLPVPPALLALASGTGLLVTVEDGVRAGGAGSRIALAAAEHCPGLAVRCLGLPDEYLPHGKRSDILAAHGLDADGIVATVRAAARRLPGPRLALVPEQGERVVRVRSR